MRSKKKENSTKSTTSNPEQPIHPHSVQQSDTFQTLEQDFFTKRSTLSENQHERELCLLYELSQFLNSSAHIADTLDGALKLMARHLNMMRSSITLLSPQGDKMHIEAAYGLNPIEKARGHYKAGEGVIGKVISGAKPMLVTRISEEPLFLNRTRSRDVQKDAVSFLCVPIIFDDQVIGALSVDRIFNANQSLEEEVKLLCILASMLSRAAKLRQSYMQNSSLSKNSTAHRPSAFVGNSEAMELAYTQIAQVAPSCTTVLICGESGTGKELTAQAIHAASPRAHQAYVSLNCAALPENLIESELFGHEKGAFTGAIAVRKGRFEMAHGGTLFLDEIGELSLLIQAKLLRVLQDHRFERLGGTETRQVDIRIIAATNRSLEDMVEQGTFRKDLYYRLNVFPITLAPLRERKDDIALLANHFMQKYAAANGRNNIRLSLTAVDMLQRYAWPGNARELQNIMERATLLVGEDGFIRPEHLPVQLHRSSCLLANPNNTHEINVKSITSSQAPLQERLDELEYVYIVESLEQSKGHLGQAAQMLGLTERVMALRLRKYNLSYKKFREKE